MKSARLVIKLIPSSLLLIASLMVLQGCNESAHQVEWFKRYFTESAKLADSSQRIFCIWFGGDRQAYTNEIWIGGNSKESKKFFTRVENLLSGLEIANVPLNFQFEIVVDEATRKSEASALDALLKKFPKHFKVTLLNDIKKERVPPSDVMEHATAGNPALASDALRIWYLQDPNFFTNVYIDIDTFIDKIDHLDDYSDYKIFGREVEPNYVYFHDVSPNVNNDYLIDKRAPKAKLTNIQNRGLANFAKYRELLDHYKDRARFVNNPNGFRDYAAAITNLVEYQLKNKDQLIDIVAVIIQTFGPGLWIESSGGNDPDARLNPVKDKVVSAQAWKEGQGIPIGNRDLTAGNLDRLAIIKTIDEKNLPNEKDQVMDAVLRLNLLGWDHKYFLNFKNKKLGKKVKTSIGDLKNRLDTILDNLDISPEDAFKGLRSSTGGLYLSFAALKD